MTTNNTNTTTNNYLANSYSGCKVRLTSKTINLLKSYIPKGCPFLDYTMFDLLFDFINMYSWKVVGKITIKDFILLLQQENEVYALMYGNAMIQMLID